MTMNPRAKRITQALKHSTYDAWNMLSDKRKTYAKRLIESGHGRDESIYMAYIAKFID